MSRPRRWRERAAAVAEQIGTPDVAIDYDRIANTVREKFSSIPLK